MTLKLMIFTLLVLMGLFILSTCYNYEETGGFEVNSDEYYGYRYFMDNHIKDLKSCKEVDKEYLEPASKAWMKGCEKYLDMNK